MTKLYAAHAELISPIDCGSTITFRIIRENQYFSATVILTDCGRGIEWGFDDSPESLEKVDRAIEVLCRFRGALVKAKKQFDKEVANEKTASEAR